MRDVMSREFALQERFESLAREAAELRHRIESTHRTEDREAMGAQLRETEEQIERLKRRARGTRR